MKIISTNILIHVKSYVQNTRFSIKYPYKGWYKKVKLATIVEGWPKGSLFDSYYTKV